jgi:acetyl esterase/lipase
MQCSDPQHTMHTVKYGSSDSQEGDLYLPSKQRPPVICLLHGGFWRMPYSRDEMTLIAQDLAARGFAVWNIEYRRIGALGGGWPGTFQDVTAGIDHLATFVADGVELDLNRVTVIGHSAGGHLALWSAARNRHYGNGSAASECALSPRPLWPRLLILHARTHSTLETVRLVNCSADHPTNNLSDTQPFRRLCCSPLA